MTHSRRRDPSQKDERSLYDLKNALHSIYKKFKANSVDADEKTLTYILDLLWYELTWVKSQEEIGGLLDDFQRCFFKPLFPHQDEQLTFLLEEMRQQIPMPAAQNSPRAPVGFGATFQTAKIPAAAVKGEPPPQVVIDGIGMDC